MRGPPGKSILLPIAAAEKPVAEVRAAVRDKFSVYICDRFIVPVLTAAQQRDIGGGDLLLDARSSRAVGRGPQVTLIN